MDKINCIKERRKDGYPIARIARELEVDEKTVRKYLKQTDFSPTKPVKKEVSSKLDPY